MITIQLVKLYVNDTNLMKAISCRLVISRWSRDEYLYGEGYPKKQRISSVEWICTKKKDGGRELRSFIDIHKETKVRVACYMAASTNGITTNRTSKPCCWFRSWSSWNRWAMMEWLGGSLGEIEKVTGRWGNQNRWKSLKEKEMQKNDWKTMMIMGTGGCNKTQTLRKLQLFSTYRSRW